MSKIKFEAAKELITQKKYTEAKVLLKTIDHPTAREWETKLARLEASVLVAKPIAVMRPRQHDSNWKDFAMLVGGLAIVYLFIFAAGSYSPSKIPTQTPTRTPFPTDDETQVSSFYETQTALRSTIIAADSAYVATQTAISPTQVPSSTLTPSITPTPRPTLTPSLTRTPRPTRTSRPTTTPTATMAVTVMAPTTYYVLGPYDSFPLLCPYDYCENKSPLRIHVGTAVVVVAIVTGDPVPTDSHHGRDNRWYKIQISDGGKTIYRYAPIMYYGTAPPTPRPTSTRSYGPSPTSKPTITFTPSPTRRP